MAEFSALPLFTDAYLADTRHLSTLQHGAYFLMLMTAWRSKGCSLPNDDAYLAKITGMDKRTWAANKTTLLAFWRLDDQQFWVQGRLLDERNFVEGKRSKNVVAGKASALKRLNRGSTPVAAKEQQDSQQESQQSVNITSTPSPTPSPTPLREEEKAASPKDDWAILEQKLRIAAGWEREPHPNLSVVGPIIELIASGSSLELDILPVIKARSSKARATSWNYFISAIQDATKTRFGIRSAMPAIDEEKWKSRLVTARKRGHWDAKWGPIPGQPGCIVPGVLLEPNDGVGWNVWDPNAVELPEMPAHLKRSA